MDTRTPDKRLTGEPPLQASDITDLRTALDFLAAIPGQLVSTKVEVDPYLELAGVYRRVGSGTPTAPPTQIGPAMLFENVKGSNMAVVAGILASRERTALLLGSSKERLAFDLLAALDRPVPPVVVPASQAPCQEVVIKPPFDLRTVIPADREHQQGHRGLPQHAPAPWRRSRDRYLRRHHPPHVHPRARQYERELHAGPAHRRSSALKAEAMGKPLPVSVSIGLDPAIYVATSFEAPTTPLGFDELTIAGGLRGRPVELVECLTQRAKAIAQRGDRPRG